MTKPLKIYIAGPMRGVPEFNFPLFFSFQRKLEFQGYEVYNPAQRDVDHGFEYEGKTGQEDLVELGFDLGEALNDCLAAIDTCDVLALLPNWERSQGANNEVAYALSQGLVVVGPNSLLLPPEAAAVE